jgi:hypothetical protein
MRLTVLQQQAKGLQAERPQFGQGVTKQLESVKHLIWHGNTEEALERIGGLNLELDLLHAFSPAADKLGKSLGEFETYIRNNIEFIPNFGERYQPGGKGFAGNPGAPPPQEYPHQRAPSAS